MIMSKKGQAKRIESTRGPVGTHFNWVMQGAMVLVLFLALTLGFAAKNLAEASIVYSGNIDVTIYPTTLTEPDYTIPPGSGYDLNIGGNAIYNINVLVASGTEPTTGIVFSGQAAGMQNLVDGNSNFAVGHYTTITVDLGFGTLDVDLPIINKLAAMDPIGPGSPLLDQDTILKQLTGVDVGGFAGKVVLGGTITEQTFGPFGEFLNSRGYAGFQFQDANGLHYGWLDASLVYTDPDIVSLTIHGFAYETAPDTQILAGAVPLPASVLLLGSGLMGLGLLGWRRKRG
jgi:hypothetical protein